MKKILNLLTAGILSATVLTPVVGSFYNLSTTNKASSFSHQQGISDFNNYVKNNSQLLTIIKQVGKISSNDNFTGTEFALKSLASISGNTADKNTPIGQLVVNGAPKVISDTPIIVSKNIITNSGKAAISANFPAKQIKRKVNDVITNNQSWPITINSQSKINFSFLENNITLDSFSKNSKIFNVDKTLNFESFSLTVPSNDKEQVDYVINKDRVKLNMIFNCQLDLNNTFFDFSDSSGNKTQVKWSDLINSQFSQIFCKLISAQTSYSPLFDKGLININKIEDPTIDPAQWSYDTNTISINWDLSLLTDQYTTSINETPYTV